MIARSAIGRRVLIASAALALLFGATVTPYSPWPATASAAGTHYYVNSASGSDANPGTSPEQAWQSLARVNAQQFAPGDVVNFVSGSSWKGGLVIRNAGQPGAPITFRAYGDGPRPIISNPGVQWGKAVSVQAPWTVIEGLQLRDAHEAGVYLAAGADHTMVRSVEVLASGLGFNIKSQHNIITGNGVHDLVMVVNTPGGDDDYGAVAVNLQAPNNEISWNSFVNCKAPSYDYDMDGGGVELFGNADNTRINHNYVANSEGFIEVGGGSANNVVVSYNRVVNSGRVAGIHLGGNFASDVSNFHFTNNTVVDTATSAYQAFYLSEGTSSASTFILRNNIFYLQKVQRLMAGSPTFTHDHNLYYMAHSSASLGFGLGAGERMADPLFVDLAGGNYHLQAGSPAIDTGAAAQYPVDAGGVPVPAGGAPNIGAYE